MRRNVANMDIRDRVSALHLFLWQFADMCKVSATTMTVWLRNELPENDERRILMEQTLNDLERTYLCEDSTE